MSIRLQIHAYDYNEYARQVFDGGEPLLDRLLASVEREPPFTTASSNDAVRSFLCEVLRGKFMQPGLVETATHAAAAGLIARTCPSLTLLEPRSDLWTADAFVQFYNTVAPGLSAEARGQLAVFVLGRPAFGDRIESDWDYYGWLRRGEVASLRAALDATRADAVAFERELCAWLDDVLARGCDLWFNAG